MVSSASARERLLAIPALDLWPAPSPVQELARLRQALGGGPRLLIKRDDALPFGFGGNKIRKVALEAARAAFVDALSKVGFGEPGARNASGPQRSGKSFSATVSLGASRSVSKS